MPYNEDKASLMRSLIASEAWKEFVSLLEDEKKDLSDEIVESYGKNDETLREKVAMAKAIKELIRKPQKIIDSATLSEKSAKVK